ncbi:MAG: hypothetical protein PHS31_04520, partial [Victivallaceae bacterium]|nr:hypothetical protein [Victivallaceae bacterium]
IIVPADVMQPFGNILQIRNNGKATLAFDATELSALSKVGKSLYLYTDDKKPVPPELRSIFSAELPKGEVICKLNSFAENRQLLPEIGAYDQDKLYIGEYQASGSEYMGNEFQLHYLRQTGREIVDWIAGGGSGVKITHILSGGKFYDTIFRTEYPALSALRQVAKLFEGSPHQLSAQIYPKYGDKPALFCSSAASYNASGIATVVIAKRFPVPDESEVVAIIPWNGETEMTIERGFLPEKTPFAGFAPKIELEKKTISIVDNTFRYSSVFPELTVIRLVRKGTAELPKQNPFYRAEYRPELKFDFNSVKQILPANQGLKKHQMRNAKSFATTFGQNASFAIIPATIVKDSDEFTPAEKQSLCVTFRTNATNPKRFDSVYLPLGKTVGTPRYLSFYVFTRTSGLKNFDRMNWVTLRFALCGKLFSTTVRTEHWQQVVLPVSNINVAWNNLRILEPTGFFNKNLQAISFEINDISLWGK